jgi:transposase
MLDGDWSSDVCSSDLFDRSDETPVRRPRRVEVITGPERRRDWSDAEKIAIVAQALEPGVNVSEIARRHEINPQQLFGWRKRWRSEAEALNEGRRSLAAPMFAPVVVEETPSLPTATPEVAIAADPTIEISMGSVTVRVRGAVDAKTLTVVLKVLRSAG